MSEPVRGKDVTVDKLFRARCHRCPWTGQERRVFADASADRQVHLDVHRGIEEEARNG